MKKFTSLLRAWIAYIFLSSSKHPQKVVTCKEISPKSPSEFHHRVGMKLLKVVEEEKYVKLERDFGSSP